MMMEYAALEMTGIDILIRLRHHIVVAALGNKGVREFVIGKRANEDLQRFQLKEVAHFCGQSCRFALFAVGLLLPYSNRSSPVSGQ